VSGEERMENEEHKFKVAHTTPMLLLPRQSGFEKRDKYGKHLCCNESQVVSREFDFNE
jgi:hypothetical protein